MANLINGKSYTIIHPKTNKVENWLGQRIKMYENAYKVQIVLEKDVVKEAPIPKARKKRTIKK